MENLRKLKQANAEIIVRVPVIPEFNGNDIEMQKIAGFIKSLEIKKVELLPYHAMGEHKWAAAGLQATKYSVPTEDFLCQCKKL